MTKGKGKTKRNRPAGRRRSARTAARSGRSAPGPGRYDRTQSRDERRAEQRRRLIQAAAEVFASRGYAAASVDQIIRRVRMSRRTFYEHFRDLKHALYEVYEGGAKQLYDVVENAIRAQRHPVAKVREGIVAFLSSMKEHAPLARVLYHEIRAAGPETSVRHDAMRSRFVSMWMEGLRRAYEAGHARRLPDEITVYAMAAAIEAVALRYVDRGEEDRILEAVPSLVALAIAITQNSEEEVERMLRAAELAPTGTDGPRLSRIVPRN
jgi:AcrR family transcriptional regulator